jgi:hypothetical protein
MGMLPSHIAMLAREQESHPIRGDVLTLGQQGVYATLNEVKEILESQKITPASLPGGFDVKSKVNKSSEIWARRTNAQTVLSLLGAKKVFASDCSEYENPDFVIDLNYPVGDEYFEKFDVILDIGTLEHVFNIPMLLRNLNFMLKKGGEVILIAPASNSIDHGFYSISPTLFHDYFSANNHGNFSCYLSEESPDMLFLGFPPTKANIYQYAYVGPQFCLSSAHAIETIFFATKNSNDSNSSEIKIPSQSLYSNEPNWEGAQTKGNVASQNGENESLKTKARLKKLYLKLRPFLPSFLLTIIFVAYSKISRKAVSSPNLTYIGSIKCAPNFKTLNCRTTVRFKSK